MIAAILVETGKDLVIDEVALPQDLQAGQILVDVHYSGICGSQIGEIDAVKGPDRYLPHLLGHEGAGVVTQIGPGVKYVQVGDHVVLHWQKGLGIEAEPPAYRWQGRKLNAGYVTTFNQQAVVAENRVTPIPKSFDLKLASFFGCAVTTGFGNVFNDAALRPGESLIVLGAGGIGLNQIQAAHLMGVGPIIAIDLFASKLALARELGATHAINAKDTPDLTKDVEAILGSDPADVVLENTGLPRNIEWAYERVHPNHGRVILVGVPRAGHKASLYTLPLHFGKKIVGSQGGGTQPREDIRRYRRLYEAGKYELQKLVQYEIPLREINTAIKMMRHGDLAGRCLISMR